MAGSHEKRKEALEQLDSDALRVRLEHDTERRDHIEHPGALWWVVDRVVDVISFGVGWVASNALLGNLDPNEERRRLLSTQRLNEDLARQIDQGEKTALDVLTQQSDWNRSFEGLEAVETGVTLGAGLVTNRIAAGIRNWSRDSRISRLDEEIGDIREILAFRDGQARALAS